MNLLIVSQNFWPENFRINDLAAEMVRRGHSVTVLTGLPNYPAGEVYPEFRRDPAFFAKYQGVEIVRSFVVPRGTGRARLVVNYLSFALCASIVGPWKLRGRRFDAILVYEPSPVTVGIPGIVMSRVKSAPIAFWVLDAWPETLEAMGVLRPGIFLDAIGRFVGWMYRQCMLVLAPSRGLVHKIAARSGQADRVVYFPNWAEDLFHAEGEGMAPEVPLDPQSFTILFAGNVGDAQDFPSILDAAELLRFEPRIRWVIVGNGSAASWVIGEIKKRGLTKSFLMVGRHPVERMPSFYRHADALLVSLRGEPIFALTVPGKLPSYLASGKPIIAMMDGEGGGLISHAEVGLACAAGDSRGLARIVRELAAMPHEERAAMGARARKLHDAEYDRGKLMNQMESWLQQIACARAARP
ncbi:MAG: glycosyltransferase family 4 protein [Bryobacterales bacterium]|nr:glycosyltransferase family 4 protein [Bryobacterales bacterium]